MSFNTSVRRALALLAIAAIGVGTLAACGDDDKDSGSTPTTVSPESVKAPISEVLAGLPKIVEHANAAASAGATGDYTTASKEFDELHEIWETVEGTIKDTDQNIYERIETAQGLIKDGAENDNAERIQQGADDQSAAIDDFIAANS
jgi:hypothetical protein